MVESPALKRSATPTVPLKLYAGLKKKGKNYLYKKHRFSYWSDNTNRLSHSEGVHF